MQSEVCPEDVGSNKVNLVVRSLSHANEKKCDNVIGPLDAVVVKIDFSANGEVTC